ncbi:MAG TPA: enoyl-CoA hydratase-related protein [Thermoplasmata archaeon]|nr:enoyl-CoA hydratase-related protein [Thermoplasmata archaeon]
MTEPDAPMWVRYTVIGPAALLTLDHPPVNVLSREVLDALRAALDRAEEDAQVRVVVIASAAEKAFAAGANIREMVSLDPKGAREHGARGQAVARRIEGLSIPVIAAVHGACLGGGCEIALACDAIVASQDATFGQPEVNLGVMPGWGGTQRLPRRIGPSAARLWIYSGRPFLASEAQALGLVAKVVPREELMAAALLLAKEWAGKPAAALTAAKRALQVAGDMPLDRGLTEELRMWAGLFGTPDQREGMRAFLDKQSWKPVARKVSRRTSGSGRARRRRSAGRQA